MITIKILKDFLGFKEGEEIDVIPDKAMIVEILDPKFNFMYGYRATDLIRNGYARQINVPEEDAWLIWSLEHEGWWAPDWNGYVEKRKDAGLYSFDEACKIIKGANIGDHDVPNEAMIKFYG